VDKEYKKIIKDVSWGYSGSESKMRKLGNAKIRQHNKSVAVSGMREFNESRSPSFIKNLRWNLEEKYSSECHFKEYYGHAAKLADFLRLLGIGDFHLRRCTCPDLDKLPDSEILKLSGL